MFCLHWWDDSFGTGSYTWSKSAYSVLLTLDVSISVYVLNWIVPMRNIYINIKKYYIIIIIIDMRHGMYQSFIRARVSK